MSRIVACLIAYGLLIPCLAIATSSFEKELLLSARQGDVEAQYLLGAFYLTQEADYKASSYWYLKAAKQGHPDSQTGISMLYELGLGVRKDYKKAVYWSTKAAEQGDASAQYKLGHFYYYGRGVRKNYGKAAYWLEKAAPQGEKMAQYLLGLLYYSGKGVPKNLKLAYVWSSLAASQGDKRAMDLLAKITGKLSPKDTREAIGMAYEIQQEIDRSKKP